jgi:hypothetical protein
VEKRSKGRRREVETGERRGKLGYKYEDAEKEGLLCKSRAAAQWLGGAHQWIRCFARAPLLAPSLWMTVVCPPRLDAHMSARKVRIFSGDSLRSAARITWRMSEIQRLRCDLGEHRGGGACLLSRTSPRAHGWSLRTYVQLRCGPTEMSGPACQMSLDNGKETNKTSLSHCHAGHDIGSTCQYQCSTPRARQKEKKNSRATGGWDSGTDRWARCARWRRRRWCPTWHGNGQI